MKTKNFIFKLMVCLIGLIPANAWGWELSKVIRINPGDTILSSQLTEKDHQMYAGSHSGLKDLIIVKNGGTFVLKIDDLDPTSLAADENNCVVISNNGTHYLAFYKLHDQQLFILELIVNYHGTLFLDGVELQQHEYIVINNDEDAKKVISFSQDGKIHFEINWWDMSLTSEFDLSEGSEVASNLYTVSLGEIIELAKKHFNEPIDSVNIHIIFDDGENVTIHNPPTDVGLVIENIENEVFADAARSIVLFTIKDNRTVSGISSTSEDELQKKQIIYDLQGRRVRDPQPGLIYIINGKKIICR